MLSPHAGASRRVFFSVVGLLLQSPQRSSEALQQKACAALTRLSHRYAPKCQPSHTETTGRTGPGDNGSGASAGTAPRLIRKPLLSLSHAATNADFHLF